MRTPKQKRSAVTQQNVINAAIQEFGLRGYEHSSTRAVVERAKTDLVAIHYHFGGKEALHRAAAERIASVLRSQNWPAFERGRALVKDRRATRNDLIGAVCAIFDEYLELSMSDALADVWRFRVQENVVPTNTEVAAVLYSGVEPIFDTVHALLGRLIHRPPDHKEVLLVTSIIFSNIVLFRMCPKATLPLMGWKEFGATELKEIQAIERKYIFPMLGGTQHKGGRRARSEVVRSRRVLSNRKRVPK